MSRSQRTNPSDLNGLDKSQLSKPPCLSLSVTTPSLTGAEPDIVLYLKIDRANVPVLRIPKKDISDYALKPYKWLWFLGFILYGNVGSIAGSESGEAFSLEFMDGTLDLQHDMIFYSSTGQYRLFYPNSVQTRSRSSSATSDQLSMTSSLIALRDDVLRRDGDACVMSGFSSNTNPVDTCHLIQRAKGNPYIKYVTSGRNNIDVDDNGAVTDIDDLKNVLSTFCPGTYGLDLGKLAFLLTPNGLLQRDDIPRSSQPAMRPDLPGDTSFLTVHYFPTTHNGGMRSFTPHNSDIWQPANKGHWPTRTIFNHTYARAVLKRWQHPHSSEYVEKARSEFTFQVGQSLEDIERAQYEESKRKRDDRRRRREEAKGRGGNLTGLTCGGFLLAHLLSDDPGPAESIFLAIQGMKMERGEPPARVVYDDDEPPEMVECSMDEAKRENIDGWRQNVA